MSRLLVLVLVPSLSAVAHADEFAPAVDAPPAAVMAAIERRVPGSASVTPGYGR